MLTVTDRSKDLVVSELRFAAARMREKSNVADKLYFMSATWGMIQRIFNIEFDSELVFAHQVLSNTHNHINSRIQGPHLGEMTSQMPAKLFELLENDLDQLANQWELNEDIGDVLAHISLLGYVATGNGFYLYSKGLLKIE